MKVFWVKVTLINKCKHNKFIYCIWYKDCIYSLSFNIYIENCFFFRASCTFFCTRVSCQSTIIYSRLMKSKFSCDQLQKDPQIVLRVLRVDRQVLWADKQVQRMGKRMDRRGLRVKKQVLRVEKRELRADKRVLRVLRVIKKYCEWPDRFCKY